MRFSSYFAASMLISLALLTPCLSASESEPQEPSPLRIHLRDAPMAAAAELLNELGHANIAVSKGAAGERVSVDLREVPMSTVIETLVRSSGLWYRQDASGVVRLLTRRELNDDWVQVRDAQLRSFAIAYPSARSVAEQIAQLYGTRVRVASVGDRSVWTGSSGDDPQSGSDVTTTRREGGIQPAQDAVLQEQAIRVTVDEASNRVLLRSSDEQALREIADLIEVLDRPIPQVLLEVKILEVQLREGQETAVEFTFDDSQSPSPTVPTVGAADVVGGIGDNPVLDFLTNNEVARILGGEGGANTIVDTTPGGLVYTFVDRHVQATLRALREEGRVSSLGSPLILSLNNRESTVNIGESRPIVTDAQVVSVQTGVDGNNNPVFQPVQTPVYSDRLIGTELSVRPLINDDRTITLEIAQQTSSLNDGAAVLRLLSGTQLVSVPIDTVTTSRIEGTVMARDGHTLILGGLVRQSMGLRERKVPLLGDIPLLGFLFRSRERSAERNELIVLFTPYIINTDEGEGEYLRERRLQALSRHPWVELGDDALDVFGPQAAPRRPSSNWYQPHLQLPAGDLP